MSEWPTGAELIARERERQIAKGYTPEHDDANHTWGSLSQAGFAFELNAANLWPWDIEGFHPRGALWNLVRAGAMFQASADQIERRNGVEDSIPRLDAERIITAIDRLLWEVSDAVGGPVKKPVSDD